MTNKIETEYLSDVDLDNLPVGTIINCSKGMARDYLSNTPMSYEIKHPIDDQGNVLFEQGDKDALAFIDTEEIIKHLEGLGYQVIEKSVHGDVLEQLQVAQGQIKAYKAFRGE